MFYSGTSIKDLYHEMDMMRLKSTLDDCHIAHLVSLNECHEREIRRMIRQLDQMHEERMAQRSQGMQNTVNNYNAPVVCNGGTLAGDVINEKV